MKSEYKTITLSSDEVEELFKKLGFFVEVNGTTIFCHNEHCESYDESNGYSSELVLTNDDFIIEIFTCTDCSHNNAYITYGPEFDRDFYEAEMCDRCGTDIAPKKLNNVDVDGKTYKLCVRCEEFETERIEK